MIFHSHAKNTPWTTKSLPIRTARLAVILHIFLTPPCGRLSCLEQNFQRFSDWKSSFYPAPSGVVKVSATHVHDTFHQLKHELYSSREQPCKL
jgi:hypothetical protein